jgi:uncharacterized protein
VNSNRYPLRINVGFFKNQAIGSSRDIPFDFPILQLSPDLEVEDLVGMIRINRTQQGLLVQGEFSACTQAECSRCLTPFQQPLSTTFDELWAYAYSSVTESGLIVPEDGNIDFAPIVREYLLIEEPINPICKPDCRGLCEVCGENLNLNSCEHHPAPVQS